MKLRTKIFLITGVVLGVLFFAVAIFLSTRLSTDFLKLERDDAENNISRVRGIFENQADGLSVKLVDWAQWDDMYQFAQDQNEAFIVSNFPDETFMNLQINFVVVVNKEGRVVYQKFVTDDGDKEEFPPGLAEYFAQGNRFVTSDKLADSKQGILVVPGGVPAVTAVRPITSSDGTAPENGAVVFGYYFNESKTRLLSDLTRTDVSSAPFVNDGSADDFSRARNELSAATPFFIESPKKQEDKIYGYAVVTDMFGSPALILRSGTDRNIFIKGIQTQRMLLQIMLGLGASFILIVFLLFEFLVIRKIYHLSYQIKKIREKGNRAEEITVRGRDEFSQLVKEINMLLESLRASDDRKKEYIKEIERMNSMMVLRELRMVELKKEIAELKNNGNT